MFGLFGWKEFGSESIASIFVVKGLFTNKQVSIQIHSTMKNHKNYDQIKFTLLLIEIPYALLKLCENFLHNMCLGSIYFSVLNTVILEINLTPLDSVLRWALFTIEYLWLSGKVSELRIQRSEVWFHVGIQNFFFVLGLWHVS